MSTQSMTHASLCTGIGACELAATWLGWKNLFSCEIDEFCNKILKHHYPKARHYGNIFEQDFREWRGRVDVLTAGFPCQPFSCAGKRNGAEDDRYLWPVVLRVIDEVRPTWFIGENVTGTPRWYSPARRLRWGVTRIPREKVTRKRKCVSNLLLTESATISNVSLFGPASCYTGLCRRDTPPERPSLVHCFQPWQRRISNAGDRTASNRDYRRWLTTICYRPRTHRKPQSTRKHTTRAAKWDNH